MQETQKTWVRSLGQEDLLEEGMVTTPVFLQGKAHGQRSLVGCSSRSRKESDATEVTEHAHTNTSMQKRPGFSAPHAMATRVWTPSTSQEHEDSAPGHATGPQSRRTQSASSQWDGAPLPLLPASPAQDTGVGQQSFSHKHHTEQARPPRTCAEPSCGCPWREGWGGLGQGKGQSGERTIYG